MNSWNLSQRPLRLCGGIAILLFVAWASVRLFTFTAADIYDSFGRQRLESKQYESAESYFAKSVRLAGKNFEYQMHLGDSLYALAGLAKTNDSALADLLNGKQAFEKATELNPLEGNAWLGLAQTCWWLSRFKGHENEFKRVESYFQKALATDPNNGQFLYALVDYYLSSPQPLPLSHDSRLTTQDSLSPQSSLTTHDSRLTALTRLATVYPGGWYDFKEHPRWTDDLQAHFIEGLKMAANNPLTDESALFILAGLSAESKKWDEAAAYTDQLIRQTGARTPVSAQTYFQLGMWELKAGHPAEAKKAFLQGLKLSKDRVETLDGLIPRFEKTGAAGLYLDLAKETAAFDPAVLSSLQLIRGKAYFFIAEDLDSAEACFHQALKNKETAAPHRYLAEIAMKRKDWDKAELESHRASLLAPKDGYLHYLFARSLQEQRRYIAALEAIGEAIQNAPRPNAGYFDTQAWLYWSLGDYTAAIQAWESGRQIDPKSAGFNRQIALAYKMLKDYSAAERFYLAALELDPGNADIAKELQALRSQMAQNK